MKKWLQRLFATSTNANKNPLHKVTSSNEDQQITNREPIDGTPFWMQQVNGEWFVTLKGYKLSPTFKKKQQALEYIWLENNGWNVIANMIIIIHEQVANEAAKEFERRMKGPTPKEYNQALQDAGTIENNDIN